MIWILLGSGAIGAGAIWICIRLARRLRQEKKRLWDSQAQIKALERTLEERQELIQKMEEANREAAEKKDSLHHGTDAERFNASKHILQDLSRGPGDRADRDSD